MMNKAKKNCGELLGFICEDLFSVSL